MLRANCPSWLTNVPSVFVAGLGMRFSRLTINFTGCMLLYKNLPVVETLVSSRKSRGWSVTELALKTGIHSSSIRQFESGKRRPTLFNLNRLWHVLEIPASQAPAVPPPVIPQDVETPDEDPLERLQQAVTDWTTQQLITASSEADLELYRRLIKIVELPLLRVIQETSGSHQVLMADLLGINRNTLRAKLLAHNLMENTDVV